MVLQQACTKSKKVLNWVGHRPQQQEEQLQPRQLATHSINRNRVATCGINHRDSSSSSSSTISIIHKCLLHTIYNRSNTMCNNSANTRSTTNHSSSTSTSSTDMDMDIHNSSLTMVGT